MLQNPDVKITCVIILPYIIHLVYKGEGIFQKQNPISKTTSTIKSGDVFGIHKADSVIYHSNPETPFHSFWIGFDGNEAKYIITEIASRLSLTDIYCFSKLFKKQYEISPRQYRKGKNDN